LSGATSAFTWAAGGGDIFQVQQWDVTEFAGKSAIVEIVDHTSEKSGHIEVDHILQSDASLIANASRIIKVDKRVLNLPVKSGGAVRRMSVMVNGTVQRSFAIELADGPPDWWVFMDLSSFAGQETTIQVDQLPENSTAFSLMDQSDEPKEAATIYREPLRPQIHFTSQRGRLNDPNGLVFYQGEYHLFYQLLPYSLRNGEKHWGHAVSTDLVHWKELPVALYPDELGPIYSGSAVVDVDNSAGFQTGKEKALVAIYTAAGNPHTQCLAFSNDRGRTWQKYEHNPVMPAITGGNRDPKVMRHGKQWIMIVFTGQDRFAILTSPDLKRWERVGEVAIPGDAECPELFEIPLNGNKADTRWIVCGAKGLYLIGQFDGTEFTSESGPHSLNTGNSFYAAQTFSDIPDEDGRRILIPWSPGDFPGMPFSQSLGLPVELTLRTTADGPRLFASPVKELATLRTGSQSSEAQPLAAGRKVLMESVADLFELETEIAIGNANQIDLNFRGVRISYNATRQELTCLGKKSSLEKGDGRIRLHVFCDGGLVDVFANGGAVYMPMKVEFPADNRSLGIETKGEGAQLVSFRYHHLKSAWTPHP
jgi:sucrose-6-phosphate hydrolase SacC (GH32 family)